MKGDILTKTRAERERGKTNTAGKGCQRWKGVIASAEIQQIQRIIIK